jgi:SAM-dependent methyltransferase
MEGAGRDRLDEEELGRTVQLLYDAFSLIDSVGGSLSPYVPTQDYIVENIVRLVDVFASRMARGRSGGPPVYYEPGCGTGRVASRAARRGMYSLCLELDAYLAREAAEKARYEPLMDVVVGDLSVFRPVRVDVVYAYLLPRAVRKVLEALQGSRSVVVSLDYPAEGDRGVLSLSRLEIFSRSLYVYKP